MTANARLPQRRPRMEMPPPLGVICLLLAIPWLVSCQSRPEQQPPRQAAPTPATPRPTGPPRETAGVIDYTRFLEISMGAKENDCVGLYATGASFYVRTKIEKVGAYDISLYARNSRPGPVMINVIDPDDPTTRGKVLAQFVFDKNDSSWSTQTQTVELLPRMGRLRVMFMNDYLGPKGDRNAHISRVVIQPVPDRPPKVDPEKQSGKPGR